MRNGALQLHKLKLVFGRDADGNPEGVRTYPIVDSNRLVSVTV